MLFIKFPFSHEIIECECNTNLPVCCVDVFTVHEYQFCKYAMFCLCIVFACEIKETKLKLNSKLKLLYWSNHILKLNI